MAKATEAVMNLENLEDEAPAEWAGDELAQFLAAAWRNTVHGLC